MNNDKLIEALDELRVAMVTMDMVVLGLDEPMQKGALGARHLSDASEARVWQQFQRMADEADPDAQFVECRALARRVVARMAADWQRWSAAWLVDES